MQMDLLEYKPTYPEVPGHRGVKTSRLAADRVAKIVTTLDERVYAILLMCGEHGATTDEVVDLMPKNERIFKYKNVQPAISRLRARFKVNIAGEDTNEDGNKIYRWKAV